MGYVDFETDNAIYRVELVQHSDLIKGTDFEADAIVLELGTFSGAYIPYLERSGKLQVTSTVDLAISKSIPIFLADVDRKETIKDKFLNNPGFVLSQLFLLYSTFDMVVKKRQLINRRTFINMFGVLFLASESILRYLPLAKIKDLNKLDWYRKLNSEFSNLIKSVQIEGRNVIIAEKTEKFVAQEMRKRLGRKPRIYLTVGVGHNGIVDCLKNLQYREKLLDYFSPITDYFEEDGLIDCGELNFRRDRTYDYKYHDQIIQLPKPTLQVLEERRKIAEMLERRLEIERSRPTNMHERKEPERVSRRDLFKRLMGKKV